MGYVVLEIGGGIWHVWHAELRRGACKPCRYFNVVAQTTSKMAAQAAKRLFEV